MVRVKRRGRKAPVPGGPTDRALHAFVGGTLLALTIIALAAAAVAPQLAQRDALRDAQRMATRLAAAVVAPAFGGVMARDAQARRELDTAIQVRISEGQITESNVWRSDGTVLYADRAEKIGQRYPPTAELLAAVRGVPSAKLGYSETAREASPAKRVEVYVPLAVAGQPPLAFEVYFGTDSIRERTTELSIELTLIALVPLVLLQVVQTPIALSLARRVGRQDRLRAVLLDRTLSVFERERRAIAADLHDGVVQDLAGVGYALAALTPMVPPERRAIAEQCTVTVQRATDALRRLTVEIYPPDLSYAGLTAALEDLAAPLRAAGTEVQISAGTVPVLAPEVTAALYRTVREALTNVAKHAAATAVQVELSGTDDGTSVRLRVVDNGRGLPPATRTGPQDGRHLGVRLVADRIDDLGGRFSLGTGQHGGTVAEAVLPAGPGGARAPQFWGDGTPPAWADGRIGPPRG